MTYAITIYISVGILCLCWTVSLRLLFKSLSQSVSAVSVCLSVCLSLCLSLFLSLSARCAQAEGTLTSSELRRLSPATTWHRQCHWDGPSQKLPWSPGADSENNLDVWLAWQLYKVYTVRQREQRKPNWNPKKKRKKKELEKKRRKKKKKKSWP